MTILLTEVINGLTETRMGYSLKMVLYDFSTESAISIIDFK